MKVCPKCQASFAEEFVYCPADAALLARYDLRARLRAEPSASLRFLLPVEALPQRLGRELRFAFAELRRDPRGFAQRLWRGEGHSRRRAQLLQSGAACAVIAYACFITALALAALWRSRMPQATALTTTVDPPGTAITHLVFPVMPKAKSAFTRGRNGHLGGSLPQPQRAQGGGGNSGGQPQRASRGAPPASLEQQLLAPNFKPPTLPHPSLVMPASVVADPRSLPPNLKLGDVNGVPAPPSPGRGPGDGIGDNGKGKGVGEGEGPGAARGRDGGLGGNRFKPPGGDTTGIGDREPVPMATGDVRPRILYKEKARYSEEARNHKLQGTVVLIATFTADGRITDIRALRPLPYGLTEEAIRVAQRIRFAPAMKNGVPVTVRAQIEYNFALY